MNPRRPRPTRALARIVLGAAAALLLLGTAACAGDPPPGPPAPSIGSTLDRPVAPLIDDLPLIDDAGHSTSLGAFAGKVIVLTDFLTLCQDVCPMTSANFAQLDRDVTAAHLAGTVQFVELTVDPARDSPARLRAYRRLFHAPANWSLLTGEPVVIARIWRYFGAAYSRGPEDKPAGIDWLTGKKLTYDVDHSDVLVFIDKNGAERFVIDGLPNTGGHLPPGVLTHFLDELGRKHLARPGAGSWTVPDALTALSWLTRTNIHDPQA